MAIRRCPYCKAIIDEEDKYCNNCGTQLLFPEDESVEEEIPGDKIIEEEPEEEKEEQEEEWGEEIQAAGAEEEGEEEFEEEEGEIETEEAEFEEETKEEEAEQEAEEAAGGVEGEEIGEPVEETEGAEEEEISEPGVEETGEEIERPEERPREDFLKAEEEEGPEKKYKVSLEDDELVFKTKDLEKLTQTVDEGKKRIEDLLASYEEKDVKKEGTPSLFREEAQEEAQEERAEEEAGEKVARERPSDTKEGLPPWVSKIKEVPPTSEMADQEEDIQEKQRPGRREWTADSGIGLPPERLTQAALPFADTATLEEAKKIEMRAEEKAEAEEKEEAGVFAAPARRPFKLKAKLVDLVFITAFWLVSLWFTAQVIGVSFFRLMAKSPLPVLGFYLILALLYFFLFLYFIGETLGDHYFSEEE